MLCTVLSLCLGAYFRLCYVQLAVTTFVASLRACLASLGRAHACMHIFEAGQEQSWCADCFRRTFVKAANETLPYIDIYIYSWCTWGWGISENEVRHPMTGGTNWLCSHQCIAMKGSRCTIQELLALQIC